MTDDNQEHGAEAGAHLALWHARQRWRALALCRGMSPSFFYPAPLEDTVPAKATCAACPVRRACLDEAMASREPEGIWGGQSAYERRRLVRAARQPAPSH